MPGRGHGCVTLVVMRIGMLTGGGDCPGLNAVIRAVVRKGEAEYKDAQEELAHLDEPHLIEWLTEHPAVIERPIVVTAKGARIGRPPENVLDILD